MAIIRRVRGFRHTVDIQSLQGSTARGTRGQSSKAFAPLETIQCSITPLSGRELTQAREIVPSATHRVEAYYTTNLKPHHRLLYGDRVLNIEAVQNDGERDRYCSVLCTEEVSS